MVTSASLRLIALTALVATPLVAPSALAGIECTSDTQQNRPGFIRFGTLAECMEAASHLNSRFGLVINEERSWESTGFYCWGKDDWPVLSLFPNRCMNRKSHIGQLNEYLPLDAQVGCHDWWGPNSVVRNTTCAEEPNNLEQCLRSCQKTAAVLAELATPDKAVAPFSEPAPSTYREVRTPAPPKVKVEHKLLILGGGKTLKAAERWRQKNAAKVKRVLHPGLHSVPLKTDGIEGLKPGFFIFEGGSCQGEGAEEHLKKAKKLLPGSYIKTVKMSPFFGQCPKIRKPSTAPSPDVILLRDHPKRGCDVINEPLYGASKAARRLGTLPATCPKDWDIVFSRDPNRLLIRIPEGTYLIDGNRKTMVATKLPLKGRPHEAAFFDYETDAPVIVYSPKDGASPQFQDGPNYTQTVAFRGKRYTVDISVLAVAFCIKETYRDGAWVASEPTLKEFHEGYSTTDCGVGARYSSKWTKLYWWPSWIQDASVKKTFEAKAVKTYPNHAVFDWGWAGTGDLKRGGMVASIIRQEIGPTDFTGVLYAFDGKEPHALESLTGSIRGFTEIAPNRIFVCTSEGHGVFDGQTGWATYWQRGTCPVFRPKSDT